MQSKDYTPMDTEKQLPSYQQALLSKTHQPQHHQQFQQQPQVIYIEQQQQQQQQPIQTTRCQTLRSFAYLIIFVSLLFLLLSLIFKFQAVSHINMAINGGCPFPCIDNCYNDFGQKVSECIQQGCDLCDSLGMQDASRYTLLYIVFLTIGGLLIFIQLFSMCFTYTCLDYRINNTN